MKQILLYTLFLILCTPSLSQQNDFNWRSEIPAPEAEGFYRIKLTAEILSKLRIDLRDIRVLNEADQEIPWISKTASKEIHSYRQIPLRIVENKSQSGCCTELIIENHLSQPLSKINLSINNADAKKELSVSGSDDLINWYIVKEEAVFNNFQVATATSVQKSVWFPPSSYRYFRITINDSLSLPLKINSASTEGENREWGQYLPTPLPKITRSDSTSSKKTYIWLSFDEAYPIDRLIFHIQQPALYHRNARIYSIKSDNKNRQTQEYLASFTLSPVQSNTLDLARLKEQHLLIEIENQDNPPLKLEKIQPYFLETSLIMHSSEAGKYHLLFGNNNSKSPRYDLGFFAELIPAEIPVLEPGVPQDLIEEKKKLVAGTSFELNATWIWLAIGLVVSILLFMSVKMVKEIQKEK